VKVLERKFRRSENGLNAIFAGSVLKKSRTVKMEYLGALSHKSDCVPAYSKAMRYPFSLLFLVGQALPVPIPERRSQIAFALNGSLIHHK